MRFDLSDEEWAVIEPLLPKGGRGPKRVDDRRVLNGIFYILRTGAPWRDLPERYGPRTTVYNRYARWARRGIWKAIFDGLPCTRAVRDIAASARSVPRSWTATAPEYRPWLTTLAPIFTNFSRSVVNDQCSTSFG